MSRNDLAGYSAKEMMVCLAARQMCDGTTAFIGVGVPMLAAALAMRTVAPNLVPIFEFGGTGALLKRLPRAVGEARTFYQGLAAAGICDIMETAARGLIDYGFLGGAQIDPYGNVNTTLIGAHDRPAVRLPGSGGANDVGSLCWVTIIIMPHERRRFVPRLDFLTTPGYLDGPTARQAAGLPARTGPLFVISTLGMMGFERASGRMTLLATHPGVTVEEVLDNTGFDLIIPPEGVGVNAPPSAEELRILREDVDAERLYL
jgi:glutaconate CoA-transferase subunit B